MTAARSWQVDVVRTSLGRAETPPSASGAPFLLLPYLHSDLHVGHKSVFLVLHCLHVGHAAAAATRHARRLGWCRVATIGHLGPVGRWAPHHGAPGATTCLAAPSSRSTSGITNCITLFTDHTDRSSRACASVVAIDCGPRLSGWCLQVPVSPRCVRARQPTVANRQPPTSRRARHRRPSNGGAGAAVGW